MIDFDDMAAAAGPSEPAGQVVFPNTTQNYILETWTVPAGVTSISMVCVGLATGNGARVEYPVGTTVCNADNGARIGDGGGDGGAAAPNGGSMYGGNGGAGGYTGNGGNGGNENYSGPATAGSGGGGGGGGGNLFSAGASLAGGGVGLLGQGANGAAGSAGVAGGAGSGGSGRLYGGGADGAAGGALSWKNNVAVTPGTTARIVVPPVAGAVRIMWGGGRSYPYNAGDV